MTLQDEAREKALEEQARKAAEQTFKEGDIGTLAVMRGVYRAGFLAGARRVLSPETVEMVARAVWVKLYARNYPNINVERDWDVMDPDTKDYCREIAVAAITTLGMRT